LQCLKFLLLFISGANKIKTKAHAEIKVANMSRKYFDFPAEAILEFASDFVKKFHPPQSQ
jgi:hypothetical protein